MTKLQREYLKSLNCDSIEIINPHKIKVCGEIINWFYDEWILEPQQYLIEELLMN